MSCAAWGTGAKSSSQRDELARARRKLKRLILTGDDFGRSQAVNEAIERHHQAGLLTQASLMVNEDCVDEAVRIARRHPALCVGLHLTLCDGRASAVSAITDARGRFFDSPARAGLRYAFDPRNRAALGSEIAAQFARFKELGFPATYLDGHTHLHLHPVVFRLALGPLTRGGFKLVRLVREPGNFAPVALIFRALSHAAARALEGRAVGAADRVYGLRDTGRMTSERFARILAGLPAGLSELYFHPGAEPAELDLAHLRELLDAGQIELTSAAAAQGEEASRPTESQHRRAV
jgi:hopanoid biosynthesis associated protein HpnK